MTARRDILTTKLSNLQLKIWNNWQQTIEKRIAKGLDSKVMMMTTMTMSTMIQDLDLEHMQSKELLKNKCENCQESIREKTNSICFEKNEMNVCDIKNTWLAKNQKYSSLSSACIKNSIAATYCHHVNTGLCNRIDSSAGANKSNTFPKTITVTHEADESRGLNKSSFVSDIKILEINLSIELFSLLRETKYLLALHELQKKQKPGETSAAAATCTSINMTTTQQELPLQQQQHLHPHQLPSTLLDLYAQRDIFWQRKIKLMKIAEYYNSIREGLTASNEMQLIQPVVDVIDERVAYASKTLTWHNFGKKLQTKNLLCTQIRKHLGAYVNKC